jgi:hypothetical protein
MQLYSKLHGAYTKEWFGIKMHDTEALTIKQSNYEVS